MKQVWLSLLTALVMTQVACSRQWRESKEVASSQEMKAAFEEIVGYTESEDEDDEGGGTVDEKYEDIANLFYDPATTIYYADSSTALGPAPMVASFGAFDFMSEAFTLADVQVIKVFFLDRTSGGSRENALLVDVELKSYSSVGDDDEEVVEEGGFVTDVFMGRGSVSDGKFSAQLDEIVVKSYDVNKNNDLNGTIQLKVYRPGASSPIGKFPTLVGYQ